jgi:predicted metal-dependent hydrolase
MNKTNAADTLNDINYVVIFSRRRTIGISISHDKGVIIRAPFRTPKKTIEEIIHGKANWIRKHQERFLKLRNYGIPVSYSDGSIHPYIGKNYTLKTVISHKVFVRQNGNILEVGFSERDAPSVAKRLLNKWYKDEAIEFFSAKLKDILARFEKYNFRPASLVVRTMKRRWGSCSVKGKITLNTELIKMAEPCIEYVIIHELCHLKYHNHGKEFYTLMSGIDPDWKINRRLLKDHIM